MGDIERRLNKTAFKKGVTWGTEVDVNVAGTGLLALNAGAPKLSMSGIEEESAASANETDLDFAEVNASDFSCDVDYRYNGIENILLAMLMGTAGTPAQQGATTAYLHTLQMANSRAGLFGTYATEKLGKIHVVPSLKVMKYTLSLNKGLLKASFGVRGDRVIDNSSVITAMSSVTYPDKHNRARFYQGVWRMNAQSGAALATGDIIKPKSFQLEIDVPMDSERENGRYIVEPRENGKPKVKLTLEFPRMDTVNDDYFSEWMAETEKKLDLTLTGALIASTYYYGKIFQFPRLKIEDVEYADSNVIPAKLVLRGLEADAAPTGMTGITKPVQIGIMNTRTTDLLA